MVSWSASRLLLAVCCLCFAAAQPSWDIYHKTDDLLKEFRNLALRFPNRVRYEDIPDPESDQSLPVITVTDFGSGLEGKEVVLLVAGEHARELITSELALWLTRVLVGQVGAIAKWPAMVAAAFAAASAEGSAQQGSLLAAGEALLQRCLFKIIPVENVLGRKAVEGGDACLRKAASGVDLNRNWPVAWKAEVAKESDEYGGPRPFSEPESRIVRLVAQTVRPRAFVNAHSGEWAMYAPWDSQQALAEGLPGDTLAVLDKMNVFCKCMRGAAGAVAGYLALGTSMDYMFQEQHVAYPFTIEVYGPNGLGKLAKGGYPRRRLHQPARQLLQEQLAQQQQVASSSHLAAASAATKASACFAEFNPVTLADYQEVVASWVGALLVLGQHLVAHPAATAAQHDALQEQQPDPLPVVDAKKARLAGDAAGNLEHSHGQLAAHAGAQQVDQSRPQPEQHSQNAAGSRQQAGRATVHMAKLDPLVDASLAQAVAATTAQQFTYEPARPRSGGGRVTARGLLLLAAALLALVVACAVWVRLGGALPRRTTRASLEQAAKQGSDARYSV